MSYAEFVLLEQQLHATKPGDRIQFYDFTTGKVVTGTVDTVTQLRRKTVSAMVGAKLVTFDNYQGPANA